MPGCSDPLRDLLREPLGLRHKAFPPHLAEVSIGEVGGLGLSLRAGDLHLPALALRESALAHNLALMADWCARHGVSLAPHGKTTMAPQLLHRQLAAGGWGITAATVPQAALMHAHGVRRIVLANEVVDPAGLRWLAGILDADPGFDLLCLADSAAGVALLDGALAAAGTARVLPVLVELGAPGRRAGTRTDAQAEAVAAAVAASPRLRVAGLECFEGVAGPGRSEAALAEVGALLDRVWRVAERLDAAGVFAGADEIVLTAGGSVFFDRAAELRDVARLTRPLRVVLRSGCYVTHDSGAYAELSPLGDGAAAAGRPSLRPALELWSAVLSRPEPELAILGFGRRDAPHDAGLPLPLRRLRGDGEAVPADSIEVVALNDQHAMARVPADADLAVGDRVVCGISHPCTAFDKWSLLPVLDEDDVVVDAVRTLF